MQKREKWKSKTKKIFSKHIFSKCINYLYYQITFNFTMGFFLVKFSENIYIFICFIKNPPLISTVSFQHVCYTKWTLSVFQNWENHPYWAKTVTWKTQLWAELDYYLPSSLWVFPFIYSSWLIIKCLIHVSPYISSNPHYEEAEGLPVGKVVKNPPAMQGTEEMKVQHLDQEDPLE